MEDIWLNHLLCMKPPWKHQTRYIKIPCHLLQDSSLPTSLPTFTSQGAVADRPAGPAVAPSSHSDAPPRGDATPGSGGMVVVANGDVVTEDGNDDSVPMEKTRLSHVEVPPEVTWVDKKNHLQVIYFLSIWEGKRNQGRLSWTLLSEVKWMGGWLLKRYLQDSCPSTVWMACTWSYLYIYIFIMFKVWVDIWRPTKSPHSHEVNCSPSQGLRSNYPENPWTFWNYHSRT